jgi:hypothetical protein
MLIESIFSKDMGGPEKGRWVISPEKGCYLLWLWSLIATERASPLTVAAQLHRDNAFAAGWSYPALSAHHARMGHSLRTHRAGKPEIVGQDYTGQKQHLMRKRWYIG